MIDTSSPRFWLRFGVYDAHEVRVDGRFSHYDYGEKHTLTVEVDEAAYRAAYADAFPHLADPDAPVDDWWYLDTEVGPGGPRRSWLVFRHRGGHVTYWDGP